ncbi:hypothetical protein AG1IA_02388 [Rhizoctonia solani AG-1 IA]|uniref:Uncharacterized protein n=1 Tax=Thanatephorus cucumeris (strain AG1-IA) TaxID=983506 RepID=L8WZQ0_THACA|nr:hypothetical protein AG1IA_02388 [Rhizoctonia solani AG-1 IA]
MIKYITGHYALLAQPTDCHLCTITNVPHSMLAQWHEGAAQEYRIDLTLPWQCHALEAKYWF